MTLLRLIIRGVVHHRRLHIGVLAGTALSVAVLSGALLAGDSVRHSLMRTALLQLGGIKYAVSTGNRFFTEELGFRIEAFAGMKVSSALLLRGVAMRVGANNVEKIVNSVQVVGLKDCFACPAGAPAFGCAAINAKLAANLGARPGDTISIRVEKPSFLPRDAPLSSRRDYGTARGTLVVENIMSDEQLGRFNLSADQRSPLNIFVDLRWLQELVGLEGRVNLMAVSAAGADTAQLNAALAQSWRIADAGLILRTVEEGDVIQLESERVFMDPELSRAALEVMPQNGHAAKPLGCLTYLVNSISFGSNCAPYSFVMAVTPSAGQMPGGVVPENMADDEIIINRWLADRLRVETGAALEVSYYELTPANSFMERKRNFRLRDVVPMESIVREREFGPKFPGLTDADRCADWDISMPLEESLLADRDNEEYWREYRTVPKAFVTLKAGRNMWANRFGDLTAVRYAAERMNKTVLEESLRGKIKPAAVGLEFQPIEDMARRAAEEAVDFGGLFLGMSFFLIVSALTLAALLFVFGVQQRSDQAGLLLALGFAPSLVQRIFLAEGCIVAALGALIGAALGTLYSRAVIWGLSGLWRGAVAGAVIEYHAAPLTVLKGAAIGFLCAVAALAFTVRHSVKQTVVHLLARTANVSGEKPFVAYTRGKVFLLLVLVGIATALALIFYAVWSGTQIAVLPFFIAGILLLVSGLGLVRLLLVRFACPARRMTVAALGLRYAGRNVGRSLAVVGLVACGCFMVFSVASMQENIDKTSSERWSGTGGFALYGKSALPVMDNPGTPEGRRKLKLDLEPALINVGVVPLKLREGDDAGCLNLNRSRTPHLLGVDADEFISRGAFTLRGHDSIWRLLERTFVDGSIPALVGDFNTAAWGLRVKTGMEKGDTLLYRDERGQEFKVRLVGSLPARLSVFHGSVIIKIEDFTQKYPSESGYRVFLIDAPRGSEHKVSDAIVRRLGRAGVDFAPAVNRLKEFYAVELTYLNMFLFLGGLGILLGSAGMGVVVLRNIMERRVELSILSAVGFSMDRVRRMVYAEHWLLLGSGLTVGILSSIVAVWPALDAPATGVSLHFMIFLVCALTVFNLALIYLCVRFALRLPFLSVLRNE